MAETTRGLLSGVRVLDMSRILAGPIAAQMLGDMGAEIIKVERPGTGDDARHYGPEFLRDVNDPDTRESAFFLCANRNKRSITIDLAKPDGQALVGELVAKSDILIENYKAGQLKRYNLDYESLKSVNPKLIYCSLTGYGQSGPYSDRPGYDGIFQAMGGLMSVTGHPDGRPGGGPMKVGPSIVDLMTGYNAVAAVLAALHHRNHLSEAGQHIDVALFDCSIAMMSHFASQYLVSGRVPPRRGTQGNGGIPNDIFTCKDGPIFLTVGTNDQFERFCDAIERPELTTDPRFDTVIGRSDNRNALSEILDEVFRRWERDVILARLIERQVPAGTVNDLAQVFADPQVKHRELEVRIPHPYGNSLGMVAHPVKYSDTPITDYRRPPFLGEHTDEILRGLLGKSEDQIAELRHRGVI